MWLGCPCCAEGPTRRGFLAAATGLAAAAVAVAPPAVAQGGLPRVLRVRRQVTNDTFSGIYWRDGRYDREALRELDYVLRDLSAAETTPMDPRLFDVMYAVARTLDSDEFYEVVSGYRTPETNAARSAQSRRVSTVSLHMSGMAADVRLPGQDSFMLARLAAEMQIGGVGLYRRDGFVHLDCGPARRW